MNEIIEALIAGRETTHYVDLAVMMRSLSKEFNLSERGIAAKTGYSKSEVHRLLTIANCNIAALESARTNSIEKYVLLEYQDLPKENRKEVYLMIINGQITKRGELRRYVMRNKLTLDKKSSLKPMKPRKVIKNVRDILCEIENATDSHAFNKNDSINKLANQAIVLMERL